MLNTTARQNTTPRTVLVVEDEPTLATPSASPLKDGPLAWPGTALPPSRPRPSYAPIW